MEEIDSFLTLLRLALWGGKCGLPGQEWTHGQVSELLNLAGDQAVAGLIAQSLIDSGSKLQRQDVLDVFETRQSIWQRNMELDAAVADLCASMRKEGIRIWVVKGQTLALLYPQPKVRSCGDIDFLCHPDDWEKAVKYFQEKCQVTFRNPVTPKDEEFSLHGIKYEMHRTLVMMSHPDHQRYWDRTVMSDIIASDSTVIICGIDVPVLPPTLNALYVFTHIFCHLISDGIGIRQFCDWALVLKRYEDEIDRARLSDYLDGIGLKRAFVGFGAVLTDYIGLDERLFPFEIPERDHRRAASLWKNIIEYGNFGKNKSYIRRSGPIHGIQHLGRIASQSLKFGSYAPSETLWKIPRMFRWWGEKVRRIAFDND